MSDELPPPPDALVRTMDCVQGMRRFVEDDSVDVVVTSPPYNLGIAYNSYMDRHKQEDYLAWCRDWAAEVSRILKPEGSFFLNLGASPSNPTIPHELLFNLIQTEQGGKGGDFVLQNNIHWIKAITVIDDDGNEVTQGHFKPINSKRFLNDCHEYVFHLTLHGKTPIDRKAIGVSYKHKSNIKRWGHTEGNDKRCRGNTWFIPYRTIQSKTERPHPATFPPELPENCIRLHGATPEITVLDPFLGIGNSWIAATRCGVGKFFGFDLDKEYVSLARKYVTDDSIVWPGTPPAQTSDGDFAELFLGQ